MNWKTLALFAAFAVGCGKKKEPENAGGPTIETGIGMVDVNRKSNPDGQDQRWINAPVTVTNKLAGPITVTKIVWHIGVSTQDLGDNSKEFNEQIAAGAKASFTLTNMFQWKDETPLLTNQAHVTGTITWTGPKGNANETAFDLTGEIKDEPAADVLHKEESGEKPAGQ